MQKYIILSLLTFNFLLGHEADHIIFTQITITPEEAEVIAIHNPTDDITLKSGDIESSTHLECIDYIFFDDEDQITPYIAY